MLLSEIHRNTKEKFDELKIQTSEIESRTIIKKILGLSDKDFIMDIKISLSNKESEYLSKVILQRLSGKPLSRIFGSKEFFSMKFDINEFVLDPRPESEILVEKTLDLIQENNLKSILEFGVGSGCIIAAILSNSIGTKAVGIDISEKAIMTAKSNLIKNGIKNFDLIVGDWGSSLDRSFDIIVSNPPYIKSNDIKNLDKNVKDHDPLISLDGGCDGLDCFRVIANQGAHLIKDEGYILVEIGHDQTKGVEKIFENNDFLLINKVKDYSKLDRVLIFVKKKIKK
ncbi:MAG: protein-(glutamine-N5) methyltransferase, release factor-specific [Rhodobiaceae bacterium]|jgi:release factor glutamine methyltransferase|nr:protein-(glutamine-N5) methyltransferase, release factor-specific [Rhodobiaceae bacterium]